MTLHTPASADDLSRLVADAFGSKTPLSVNGNATRAGLGRPVQAGAGVSTARLTGITLHEPAELVIAARAGTPVSEVEAALRAKGQRLPFEPMDHRGLYGSTAEPTVGGLAATNASGPARINLGAARDSMIGVKFINGRGEDIQSGGRVMKNVTGLDLVKGLAGSHGTLAVIHEVCFKVLPLAEREATLVLVGLPDGRAIEALSLALGSPFEPTGAAHLPQRGSTPARTLIRIEGFAPSIAYRTDALSKLLKAYGPLETMDGGVLWRDIRDGMVVNEPGRVIWRISVAPSKGEAVGQILRAIGGEVAYDWGGGLIWAGLPASDDASAVQVHAAARLHGGYATLMRAPEPVRLAVDVFSPPAAPLMALTRKFKAALDPHGILNPGRMYAGV